MRPRRRRGLVRTAGVMGVVTQALVGLMSIVIFPAALVSLLAGAAGVRLVGRDREASSMRFGVALLASLVGLVFGFASGPMLATATVSTGSYAAAWVLVQRLERESRTAFGIKHRAWERRQAELAERRDEFLLPRLLLHRRPGLQGPADLLDPTIEVLTPLPLVVVPRHLLALGQAVATLPAIGHGTDIRTILEQALQTPRQLLQLGLQRLARAALGRLGKQCTQRGLQVTQTHTLRERVRGQLRELLDDRREIAAELLTLWCRHVVYSCGRAACSLGRSLGLSPS